MCLTWEVKCYDCHKQYAYPLFTIILTDGFLLRYSDGLGESHNNKFGQAVIIHTILCGSDMQRYLGWISIKAYPILLKVGRSYPIPFGYINYHAKV